jgi:hypothetical protein
MDAILFYLRSKIRLNKQLFFFRNPIARHHCRTLSGASVVHISEVRTVIKNDGVVHNGMMVILFNKNPSVDFEVIRPDAIRT